MATPKRCMPTADAGQCVYPPCLDWKQKKKKRSQAVGLESYRGLAEVAVRCLCELLLALPHFNFHNNIIVVLVPLMNDPARKVGQQAQCDAFRCVCHRCQVVVVMRSCAWVCCDALRFQVHAVMHSGVSVYCRCRICAVMRSASSSSRTKWAGLRWPPCVSSRASSRV